MTFIFIFRILQSKIKMNFYANNTSGWIFFGRNNFHFNTNQYLCSRLCFTALYTLSFRFIIFFTYYLFLTLLSLTLHIFVFLSLAFDLWISNIVYVL